MNNTQPKNDPVNRPAHYTSDPSGVECITITRHRNFNIGNAIKYLWQAGLKSGNTNIQDLKKAVWYIQDEIGRLEDVKLSERISGQTHLPTPTIKNGGSCEACGRLVIEPESLHVFCNVLTNKTMQVCTNCLSSANKAQAALPTVYCEICNVQIPASEALYEITYSNGKIVAACRTCYNENKLT